MDEKKKCGRKPLAENEKSIAINIVFPPKMAESVRERVEELQFRSIAEYVRDLVRRDLLNK
ncbi:MAG: hypothetical protein SPF17_05400 [Candidatus Mucispirillum faecigallinarum]|nr:hypothetical protein [Candidatus Mucispirillum faecigallinarum]